jgi:hypothetical protein
MANIFVSATAAWNGKALKGARKDINTFEKQIQKLGRTIGVSLGTAALVNFGKKSVQAFMADEKAAKSLEQQLKNTGYAFSASGVEMYIANLQKATGVLDDELRPAFQSLLTVTGSITLSQDALNTALNVSAATGKSVVEVSQALAKGYAGQTTALTRLGAGLSKATLKTGDMDAILAELNDKFAGQAQARLTTYAGKMDLLKVASENVKEEIGKGIIGALEALSKDTSIEDTTKKMENLGKQTGDTIKGIGVLINELGKVPGVGIIGKIAYETSIFGALARLGKTEPGPTRVLPANEQRSAGRIYSQQFRTEVRQEKELAKLRAAEIAALKAKTEVDKLRDKFDVERIGLMKALGEATDAETKLRLEAKIAILDNNEALAKKINAELEAGKSATDLAKAFGGATSALDIQIAKLRAMTEDIINKLNAKVAAGTFNPTGYNLPGLQQLFPPAQGPLGSIDYTVPMGSGNPVYAPGTSGTPMSYADVRLTIDVAQSGDQFAQLIADSVQVAQRSGYSTTSAGSLN